MSDPPKRLFLLDGHSLSYRAFFALPQSLATSTGQVTNAVYGFTSMLIKLLAEERPDLIAVARLEKYAEYKAGRPEAPDEFRQQLGLIVEVLETLRVPVIGVEAHEADDVIATLAVQAAEAGIEVVIVTADRDFFQLVRPGIKVMFNRRGISDIALYDEQAVRDRFALSPQQYLDYVALKGDISDNIPGVPGVGEKTAAKLVQDFGSVEDLLARSSELKGKLRTSIEEAGDQLLLNKDLARLETDLELDLRPDESVMGEWDMDAVHRLFTSLEFRTPRDRLIIARSSDDPCRGADAARSPRPRRSAPSSRTRGRKPFVSISRDDRSGAWPCPSAAGRPPTRPWSRSTRLPAACRTRRRRSGRTMPRTRRRPLSPPDARSPAWRSTPCSRRICSIRPARPST